MRIPKGHYEVIFAPVSEEDKIVKNLFAHFVKNRIYILIISLLLITIVLLFIQNRSLQDNLENFYIIDKDNPIWRDYLQSTIPILIAIGDHFFFTMDSNIYQNLLAIRDGKINSLEDL